MDCRGMMCLVLLPGIDPYIVRFVDFLGVLDHRIHCGKEDIAAHGRIMASIGLSIYPPHSFLR